MSEDDADRDDDLLPPEEEADPPDPSITGPSGDGDRADVDAPLGDLAERAREGREQDADGEGFMDAFEEVEVDDVEAEQLWADLEGEGLRDVVDEPASDAERDVRVVAKAEYCMRCQHFSAPPDVRCNSEDGEILELADTEHFRVADCPILRGEEELENLRRK